VEGLSGEELARLVAEFTSAVVQVLAERVAELEPALGRLADETERRAASLTAAVVGAATQEIVRAMGPAIRAMITDEIGPALRQTMADELGPGLAAMLRAPEVNAALGETARVVAREGVIGSNDALVILAEQHRDDRSDAPLGLLGRYFGTRTWLLAAIVVAAVLAIPLAWLFRERIRARRYREESERRAARADALFEAVERAGGAPSSELIALLRQQIVRQDAASEREARRDAREAARRDERGPRRPPRPRPAT
jgi:hypothetical protein